MANFTLILDCDRDSTFGNFMPYKNTTPASPNYPMDPQGQVWWEQQSSGWVPVKAAGSPGDNGNPAIVNAAISNGNLGSVAIRDQKYKIDTISMVIVFGKAKAHTNPKALASPFDKRASGTVINQTIFTAFRKPGLPLLNLGELWVMDLPPVSYPTKTSGPGRGRVFTCYIGVSVMYEGGIERQFGMDPDLEVLDYGGQRLPI